MGRFDPSDRRSDDLIVAIDAATHSINHTLREGFKLVALHISAAQGVDNSAAIEAQAQKIKDATDKLTKSLPPT
jgi:hypothetical protein